MINKNHNMLNKSHNIINKKVKKEISMKAKVKKPKIKKPKVKKPKMDDFYFEELEALQAYLIEIKELRKDFEKRFGKKTNE